MGNAIITVEHLSKRYKLGQQRNTSYTTLRDTIAEGTKGLLRRKAKRPSNEFLALDDVSFTVQQGDRVGIIGRNGAGKSTLLKILSRIVAPTKGRIVLEGRVASLLEVGTGFHPELSGRENIYLNGAILGMGRQEIRSKFDEIVAFAEVEQFLDTPVKRYSSGMYVRLAFAVAAHLEPEILIVDEVLAVGDAAFQRKCLGKMETVAGEGRTVLFVSHQMDAVQRLCNVGLLLEKGRLVNAGQMSRVVSSYLNSNSSSQARIELSNEPGTDASAVYIQLEELEGTAVNEVPVGRPWQARIGFTIQRPLKEFVIALGTSTMFDLPITTTWSHPQEILPGQYEAVFINDGLHLTSGQYKLVIGLSMGGRTIQYIPDRATITISEISTLQEGNIVNLKSGLLLNQMRTQIERIG
jgi:lipopolysaccharide transport system ATP-binding protein